MINSSLFSKTCLCTGFLLAGSAATHVVEHRARTHHVQHARSAFHWAKTESACTPVVPIGASSYGTAPVEEPGYGGDTYAGGNDSAQSKANLGSPLQTPIAWHPGSPVALGTNAAPQRQTALPPIEVEPLSVDDLPLPPLPENENAAPPIQAMVFPISAILSLGDEAKAPTPVDIAFDAPSAVPEPSMLAIFGMSIGALALRRRRRA